MAPLWHLVPSTQPWPGAGIEVALLSARAWAWGAVGMGVHRVVLGSDISRNSFPLLFLKQSWPFSLNPTLSSLESSQGPQHSRVGYASPSREHDVLTWAGEGLKSQMFPQPPARPGTGPCGEGLAANHS